MPTTQPRAFKEYSLQTFGRTAWTEDRPLAKPLPIQSNTNNEECIHISRPWAGLVTTIPVFNVPEFITMKATHVSLVSDIRSNGFNLRTENNENRWFFILPPSLQNMGRNVHFSTWHSPDNTCGYIGYRTVIISTYWYGTTWQHSKQSALTFSVLQAVLFRSDIHISPLGIPF
jgi:hypothetical protein